MGQGIQVHSDLPKAHIDTLLPWLEKTFPSQTIQPIVLETQDLEWLDLFCTQIRMSHNLSLRFSPLIWVYESFDPNLSQRVAQIGVDELLSLKTPVEEAIARINLRVQQAETFVLLQKRLDEVLRRSGASETALQQREEFLSVCAHDLRSPIGLIQSSLGMLLSGSDARNLPPLAKELLERSQRQAGNALRLVSDLLDVMSFEQGLKPQYELFTLDSFLQEFYQDYQAQAKEKGISFHYQNPISDWQVLADKDRILQLLQNLLGNALKFTESGKNVYLTVHSFTGRRKSDPPYPMVILSFKDEGKGIPHKERERIFDRFSQIKDYSRAGGRGLGLTVAKQISTLHAGNLWVESEPGKGSTFHVLLPHVVSRSAVTTVPHASPNAKKLLVVEPIEAKKKKNFETLSHAPYAVTFVRDGVEAVAMAFHLQPDIILLRHDMHKMPEGDVARIIKTNPLTSHAKVFLGLEEGESPQRIQVDESYIEGILPVPTIFEDLGRALSDKLIKAA